jgi:UDPglucose 6-dehydrogenase
MKIGLVGLGFVGFANAVMLSSSGENKVTAYDTNKRKYNKIKKYNIAKAKHLNDILDADVIIIAVPTNLDKTRQRLDTSIVDSVIDSILETRTPDDAPTILIKSTLPIGYINSARKKYQTQKILFSPEFLRKKTMLKDVFNPSRIVIGDKTKYGKMLANLFKKLVKNDPPVFLMQPDAAEAVKLFSNAYLANRIAFFNELDTLCTTKKIDTPSVISAVCADKRIGNWYNKPSHGYGGHCLPKDTKELATEFNQNHLPGHIITATIQANCSRQLSHRKNSQPAPPPRLSSARNVL